MTDLEAGYLAYRGADPEKLDYERRMAQARAQDAAGEITTHASPATAVASVGKDLAENAVVATASVVDAAVEQFAPWVKDLLHEIPGLQSASEAAYRRLTKDDTATDVAAQKFLQYVGPFTGYLKAFNAVNTGGKAATAANAVGADAMTALTAIEPHFERFSDFMQTFEAVNDTPVLGPTVDYLASREGSDAENRLKNVGDAMLAAGLGTAAATTVVQSLKHFRGVAVGTGALVAGDTALSDEAYRPRDEKGRFKKKEAE